MTDSDKVSDGAREAAKLILESINALHAKVFGGAVRAPGQYDIAEVAAAIQQHAVAPVEAERRRWSGRAAIHMQERDEARAAAGELWAAADWAKRRLQVDYGMSDAEQKTTAKRLREETAKHVTFAPPGSQDEEPKA